MPRRRPEMGERLWALFDLRGAGADSCFEAEIRAKPGSNDLLAKAEIVLDKVLFNKYNDSSINKLY